MIERRPVLGVLAFAILLQSCAAEGASQESTAGAGAGTNSAGGAGGTSTMTEGGNTAKGGATAGAAGGTSKGGTTPATGGTANAGGAPAAGGRTNAGGTTAAGSSAIAGGATSAGGQAIAGGGSSVSTAATLKVSGNKILDTCGNALVVRGVEQLFNHAIQVGGSFQPIIDGIVGSGSNAVRMLPSPSDMTAADMDTIIGAFAQAQVIVYLSPGDRTWFGRSEIKAVLDKHAAWIVLDAYQEPDFDDRARWKTEAIAAIKAVRAYGYAVPITVLANQYGRDLPSLIQSGAEIVAADTAKNSILGWQAYWGVSGWYQNSAYHMTLAEGVAAAASQSFPIQVGIDHYADPSDIMDYKSVMDAAQQHSVGWLWWNWWNPFGTNVNNLSVDGTITNLAAVGTEVISTHANSIRKTSRKACRTK